MDGGVRCGILIWVGLSLAGCAQLIGIEDLPDVPADAAPVLEQVRGSAVGLLTPVSLRLEHAGSSEVLLVEADGAFAFATGLPAGASYTVALADESPCVLVDAAGVIGTATAEIELACESVFLSAVSLEGAISSPVEVISSRTAYSFDVSLIHQEARVAAQPTHEQSQVAVNDMPVEVGAFSAAIPLALADNLIYVTVTNARGASRMYRLNVRRAKQIAQRAYGKASNAGEGDWFGQQVAVSGDTLAVSAFGEDSAATGIDGEQNDGSAPDSGAVYVFRREGEVWLQEAYLKASNTDAYDQFGWSIALWDDVLAVGAVTEDSAAKGVNGGQLDNSAPDSGAVYVFRRADGAWRQEAYLKAMNASANALFGHSVWLTSDRLAVGAAAEGSGVAHSGAAYVFRYDGARWVQEEFFKAFNADGTDLFGFRVALWGDTLAVSAVFEDSESSGVNGDPLNNKSTNSGAVYVYQYDGQLWYHRAYLKASNPSPSAEFGRGLALWQDTLAIGASGDDGTIADPFSRTLSESGAVYILQRNGSSWEQESYLKASNADLNDQFGFCVSLHGDTLVVGAVNEDSAATGVDGDERDNDTVDGGAAYVFRRGDAGWTQDAYVKSSNSDSGDSFGYSAALWNGTLVVVSAYEDSAATGIDGDASDESATDSGAVYIFH